MPLIVGSRSTLILIRLQVLKSAFAFDFYSGTLGLEYCETEDNCLA